MAKNHFRVISIFKIVIWVYKKNFEFFGKKIKILRKRYLSIFYIYFNLNEDESIEKLDPIKYIVEEF